MKKPFIYGILSLVALTCFASCKYGRFVFYNFADINDYKKFPFRTIANDNSSFQFHQSAEPVVPKEIKIKEGSQAFESYLEDNKTVAFLIIRNDSILYENYWYGYDQASIVPSFSMAKSVVSILIGCAIDEGLIASVSEPVTNYLPELRENGFESLTIEHLLQMTSGLHFNEGYANPFGDVATFYYGTNLRKAVARMKLETDPGTTFDYNSGSTQLLGLILERSLKGKTLSEYLEEKIWQPLQMEYDATWSIDRKKNGLEKTFCCLNARARDFAKIGRLYLNKGDWNGKRIVSENWVETSTSQDTTQGSVWYYQYQWWLPTQSGDFMAEGILGQYVYVNPDKNLIIVRLGKKQGEANWWGIFPAMAKFY
jgi:CubicO group peptidase (beta-lactamase class C family)